MKTSKEYMAEWREKNPGRSTEYMRKWRSENPEKAKAADNRNRIRKWKKRQAEKALVKVQWMVTCADGKNYYVTALNASAARAKAVRCGFARCVKDTIGANLYVPKNGGVK